MIQILSKKDLALIQDIDVVKCMEKQFARLEGFVDYPTEAYFIYLERIDELQQPIAIKRNGVDVIYPPLQRYRIGGQVILIPNLAILLRR